MADMAIITRIFGIGILLSVAVIVLEKSNRADVAVVLGLAGTVVVLSMVIIKISQLFHAVQTLFGI